MQKIVEMGLTDAMEEVHPYGLQSSILGRYGRGQGDGAMTQASVLDRHLGKLPIVPSALLSPIHDKPHCAMASGALQHKVAQPLGHQMRNIL